MKKKLRNKNRGVLLSHMLCYSCGKIRLSKLSNFIYHMPTKSVCTICKTVMEVPVQETFIIIKTAKEEKRLKKLEETIL